MVDNIIQRFIEIVRSSARFLVDGVGAVLPSDWYRASICHCDPGIIGWTTLACGRGRFLSLRSEDFVTAADLAAQVNGASSFATWCPRSSTTSSLPPRSHCQPRSSLKPRSAFGVGSCAHPAINWGVLPDAQNIRLWHFRWLLPAVQCCRRACFNFWGMGCDAADPIVRKVREHNLPISLLFCLSKLAMPASRNANHLSSKSKNLLHRTRHLRAVDGGL